MLSIFVYLGSAFSSRRSANDMSMRVYAPCFNLTSHPEEEILAHNAVSVITSLTCSNYDCMFFVLGRLGRLRRLLSLLI